MQAEAGSFSSSKRRAVGCHVDPPSGIAKPLAGGEPLSMMAALSVCSRRLPGITQRAVCAQGRRPNDPDTPKSLQNLEPFLFVGPHRDRESDSDEQPTRNHDSTTPTLHHSARPDSVVRQPEADRSIARDVPQPGLARTRTTTRTRTKRPVGKTVHETPRHCRSSA